MFDNVSHLLVPFPIHIKFSSVSVARLPIRLAFRKGGYLALVGITNSDYYDFSHVSLLFTIGGTKGNRTLHRYIASVSRHPWYMWPHII